MRVCPKCGIEKENTEFWKTTSKFPNCKECIREQRRKNRKPVINISRSFIPITLKFDFYWLEKFLEDLGSNSKYFQTPGPRRSTAFFSRASLIAFKS